MRSFESLALVVVEAPTLGEVLGRLRRDALCRADPSSRFCTLASAKDDYLLRDVPASRLCERCPRFVDTYNTLFGEWEEWVLAQQEAFG
jgi:hypothetical protein